MKLNPTFTVSRISERELVNAFHAAFLPAISPSKQNIIFLLYRISLFICNFVKAVPRVATAFLKLFLCRAITSV